MTETAIAYLSLIGSVLIFCVGGEPGVGQEGPGRQYAAGGPSGGNSRLPPLDIIIKAEATGPFGPAASAFWN